MTLHVEVLRDHPGPDRVVLVHGFTQNSRCWGRFAQALCDHPALASYSLVAVDAPGHGRSAHDTADLWEAGRLVAQVGADAIYLGYSMGGRIALHAALQSLSVKGLILIGSTAGIDDPLQREQRRRSDADLAQRLLAEDLETFLEAWLANPLFAGLDEEAAARPQRMTNRPEGLAASLAHCGTGSQDPLWGRLGELADRGLPCLVLAGSDDHKFTAIGRRLADGLAPSANLVTLPGTHAIHLEQPTLVADEVALFLAG